MDEATLRAIFDEKLKDVCRREDLAQVQEKLDRHEARFEELEKRLQLLELAPAQTSARPPRTSTGSSTSASSRRDHAAEWQPRLVLVRGFAPYGAGPEKNIRKSEIGAVQGAILQCCDERLRSVLEPCQGYALNHNVAFRVPPTEDARATADLVDKRLQAKSFKVRGCSVRASAETHPSRRRACAKYYAIIVSLRRLRVEGKDYEPCARGLAAYRLPTWGTLFKVLYDDATVQWNVKELEALGLQVDFDETLEEKEGMEGAATPRPMEEASPQSAQPPRSATSAAKTPAAAPQDEPPAKQAKKDESDAVIGEEPVAGDGDEWDQEAVAAAQDDHMAN